MFSKFLTKLIGFTLKRVDLLAEDKNKIVAYLLDDFGALPIYGIISTSDEGEILINKRTLELEALKDLRESARIALRNKALTLVREQVRYEAFVGGAINSAKPEDMLFYRAALWFGQEEFKQLKALAQSSEELTLE